MCLWRRHLNRIRVFMYFPHPAGWIDILSELKSPGVRIKNYYGTCDIWLGLIDFLQPLFATLPFQLNRISLIGRY